VRPQKPFLTVHFERLCLNAFAACHQLSSGHIVRSVVQRDGARIRLTGEGEEALQALVSGFREPGLPNLA
jgi:hypothetical protein